jgi:predicted nuclease of predicted toxin-antitoxin system
MKILLDMNLSPRWVRFLEQEGFEAAHWSTVGDPRATQNYELSDRQLSTALKLVRKHKDEIRAAWEKHFDR